MLASSSSNKRSRCIRCRVGAAELTIGAGEQGAPLNRHTLGGDRQRPYRSTRIRSSQTPHTLVLRCDRRSLDSTTVCRAVL